jgi:hypothetical protein
MLSLVAASFKRFNQDRCWTSAIVISYFGLLCSVPLVALFFAAAARFLGDWATFRGPSGTWACSASSARSSRQASSSRP